MVFQFNLKPFFHGAIRAFDFFGSLDNVYKKSYGYSSDPQEADYHAIRSDWETVGNDIRIAMEQFEREQEQVAVQA